MSTLSYAVSLLYLYPLQAWSMLWEVHFLLPIGIVIAVLAIGTAFILTAEDSKATRADRNCEKVGDQLEKEERDR